MVIRTLHQAVELLSQTVVHPHRSKRPHPLHLLNLLEQTAKVSVANLLTLKGNANMKTLIIIVGVIALAACSSGNVTSGTGEAGQQVGNASPLEEAGLLGTTSTASNPYACPANTVIRSDCSVESQRSCDCVLP